MSPVMEAATDGVNASGEGKKQLSTGKLRLELQKNVNSSLRRVKATDGSFRYGIRTYFRISISN